MDTTIPSARLTRLPPRPAMIKENRFAAEISRIHWAISSIRVSDPKPVVRQGLDELPEQFFVMGKIRDDAFKHAGKPGEDQLADYEESKE